jgi:hypothetical protein
MIIYLAARYSRIEEMRTVRNGLVALGHVVTSRWIAGSHEYSESTLAAMAHCASDDVEDLTAAECVISFTEPLRTLNDSRGGRHVEFGIALALRKRLIIVGHRENVFHALPHIEFFDDYASLIDLLSHHVTTADR